VYKEEEKSLFAEHGSPTALLKLGTKLISYIFLSTLQPVCQTSKFLVEFAIILLVETFSFMEQKIAKVT
jgi:hypothetical protein